MNSARDQAVQDVGMVCRGLAKLFPTLDIPIKQHIDSISNYIPIKEDNNMLTTREMLDDLKERCQG